MIKKTIGQYKEEILASRGRSIPSPMHDFNNYFQLALEKALPEVLSAVLENITTDQAFLNHIAMIAASCITPEPGKPGYTPKKGIDYDDGKPGDNYNLTEKDKLEIAAKIKPTVIDRVIERTIVEKPIITENIKIEKIENEETGAEIVQKVNALEIKPELQIDAKHIKNLPSLRAGADLSGGIARGGLKLIWNTQLTGLVNGSNTIFNVPAGLPDPKDNKYIVSARGTLKTIDAGDFTISNNNRTITFVSPPPNGSDAPRIILYHGK